MDRYNRAWRDARSPLTPLTPLTTTNVFDFDHTSDITPTAEPSMQSKSTHSMRSLQPSKLRLPHRAPPPSRRLTSAPKRFSRDFMRARSVFSPTADSTSILDEASSILAGTSSMRSETSSSCSDSTSRNYSSSSNSTASFRHTTQRTIKTETNRTQTSRSGIKREFIRGSPVEQPPLSPRVRSLLNRTGNTHLTDMFTRQEIDLGVLIRMTVEDLESLGVRGAKELKLAMDVIKFAKKYFF